MPPFFPDDVTADRLTISIRLQAYVISMVLTQDVFSFHMERFKNIVSSLTILPRSS